MTGGDERPHGIAMAEAGAIGAPPDKAGIRPGDNPARGILLMVAAMMIVPFMDAIAKYLAADYPVTQIVWARFFFHFAIMAPIVLYRYGAGALRPRQPGLQVVRGGFLLMATILFFTAIAVMPIADALALLFISPMVVTALSPMLLGEQVGIRRWTAVIVGFLGALIILRPGLGATQAGSFLAIGAGCAFAFYTLATRRLSGSAPPLVTLVYTAVLGAAVMSIAVIPVWVAPPPVDLVAERRNGDFVRAQIAAGAVTACHDVSDGGLAVALAEMALAGATGAAIERPGDSGTANPEAALAPLHAWLFGEDQARYIVTVSDAGPLLDAARSAGVPAAARSAAWE